MCELRGNSLARTMSRICKRPSSHPSQTDRSRDSTPWQSRLSSPEPTSTLTHNSVAAMNSNSFWSFDAAEIMPSNNQNFSSHRANYHSSYACMPNERKRRRIFSENDNQSSGAGLLIKKFKWTLALTLLLALLPASNGDALNNNWDRPVGMPKIAQLEVMCGAQHMEVHLAFDSPFHGLVASKGMYGHEGCVYVPPRTGRSSFVFNIYYDKCGTKPDNHGKFYENTVVVQYDEELIEAWDEAKRLRCEWFNDYEKTATKTSPMVISDLEIVELNFHGDNVDCWMEIQEGKGPWAPPLNGIVPLGSPLTMVVAVKDPTGEFDMRVKACEASDGQGGHVLPLSDAEGCIIRPKLLGKFSKVKLDDGRATVLTYAHISAFKFPDMLNVHLRCTVEICRHGCPNHCTSQYGPPPGHKQGPISNDLSGLHSRLEPTGHASQNTDKFVSPNDLTSNFGERPKDVHVAQQLPLRNSGEVLDFPPPQQAPQQPPPPPQQQPPQQQPAPIPAHHSGELNLSLLPPLPPHPSQARPTPGRPPHPQHIPQQIIQQRPGGPPQRLRSQFPQNKNKQPPPGMLRYPTSGHGHGLGQQNFPPRPFFHQHPGRPLPVPAVHQLPPNPNRQGLPQTDEPNEEIPDQMAVASEDQGSEILSPRGNTAPEAEPAQANAEENQQAPEAPKETEPQAQALKGEPDVASEKSDSPVSETVFKAQPRQLRLRRSVTTSSDVIGVQGAFRVVSQADLNFAINSNATQGPSAVFRGRMTRPEDLIHGICLPRLGFGVVFFGLGLGALVAILIAAFLAFAHYRVVTFSKKMGPENQQHLPHPGLTAHPVFPMVILRKMW